MTNVKAFFMRGLTLNQSYLITQTLPNSYFLTSLTGGRTMILTNHENEQRAILVAEMFLTHNAATIKEWLEAQQDQEYKEDMRNRFNQLRIYKGLKESNFKQEQYTHG